LRKLNKNQLEATSRSTKLKKLDSRPLRVGGDSRKLDASPLRGSRQLKKTDSRPLRVGGNLRKLNWSPRRGQVEEFEKTCLEATSRSRRLDKTRVAVTSILRYFDTTWLGFDLELESELVLVFEFEL
jgi:hypothetical protein